MPVAFFAEMPTMVGPEHDDGVLGCGACVEGVEHAADEGVREGDAGEIVMDRGGPHAGLPDAVEVLGFAQGEFASPNRLLRSRV